MPRAGSRCTAGRRQVVQRLSDDEVKHTSTDGRKTQQQGRAKSLTFDPNVAADLGSVHCRRVERAIFLKYTLTEKRSSLHVKLAVIWRGVCD